VVLAVEMRRFKCMKAGCDRRTFADNIDALAGRHQRRTHSQAKALQALGHALGGEAAARLGTALGLRASADTMLRELRRAVPKKKQPVPRVVGIDDWAIKRGHHYVLPPTLLRISPDGLCRIGPSLIACTRCGNEVWGALAVRSLSPSPAGPPEAPGWAMYSWFNPCSAAAGPEECLWPGGSCSVQ
jgi:hypothetical protein